MKRCLVPAVVLSMVSFASPVAWADAPSDIHYDGHSSQHKSVQVLSSKDGTLQRMSLSWRATDCERTKYYRETTAITFDGGPNARGFTLDGAHSADLGHGYRAKVKIGGHGKLSRSAAVWSGTWSVSVVIKRDGKPYDHCSLGSVHWSASILYQDRVAVGTFSFTDPTGDFTDAPGESHSYTAPGTPITLERPGDGFDTGFFFDVRDWSGAFANSEPLQPGSYPNATSRDLPLMYFYGNGSSCGDDNYGEFNIERYRVRSHDLMAVALTFSQSCAGDDAPVTGALDIRVVPPPFNPLSRFARASHVSRVSLQPVAHRVLAHRPRLGELA